MVEACLFLICLGLFQGSYMKRWGLALSVTVTLIKMNFSFHIYSFCCLCRRE
jgi:hypothetical protein